MRYKKTNAFVSNLGRHTVDSIGRDLRLPELLRNLNKPQADNQKISEKQFFNAVKSMMNTDTMTSAGIKISTGIILKLMESGVNSILNPDTNRLPSLSHNKVLTYEKGRVIYTNVNIGFETSKRINRMKTMPDMNVTNKSLLDTDKDFQDENPRKLLKIETGFNQKNFTFFLKKNYLTARKIEEFGKKAISEIIAGKNRKKNIHSYMAAIKTTNKIHFRNMNSTHKCSIKLHLCSLNDQSKNLEEVIKDFTNNLEVIKESNSTKKKIKDEIRDVAKKIVDTRKEFQTSKSNNLTEKVIDKIQKTLTDLKDRKVKLNKLLDKLEMRDSLGRLSEDQQLTDPKFDNEFKTSFLTTTDCNIKSVTEFRNNIRVSDSWTRTLNPGDKWEFQIQRHLGTGINLNRFCENKTIAPDHPISYFFYAEIIGDRNCLIQRNRYKDGESVNIDHFSGFSPAKIIMDVRHEFQYIYSYKDLDEMPAIYAYKINDEDFEEEGIFAQEYNKDRSSKLNLFIDDLDKAKANGVWYRVLESEVGPDDIILDRIISNMERNGFDPRDASEDDIRFNYNKDPNTNKRYNNETDSVSSSINYNQIPEFDTTDEYINNDNNDNNDEDFEIFDTTDE